MEKGIVQVISSVAGAQFEGVCSAMFVCSVICSEVDMEAVEGAERREGCG